MSPAREIVLLARQAATLDAILGGRLTLGLGGGWQVDDFAATGVELATRGARLEEQVLLMRRFWSGAASFDEVGHVSPMPEREGGPDVLLGGTAPTALERAGRLADGLMGRPLPPSMILQERRSGVELRTAGSTA